VTRRQCGPLDTPTIKEWVGSGQQDVGPLAREGCEDCIYLPGGAGIEDSDLQPEKNASSRFDVLRNGLGTRRIRRIDEHGNANCSGQQFTQQWRIVIAVSLRWARRVGNRVEVTSCNRDIFTTPRPTLGRVPPFFVPG
jgi:hypothetical protein